LFITNSFVFVSADLRQTVTERTETNTNFFFAGIEVRTINSFKIEIINYFNTDRFIYCFKLFTLIVVNINSYNIIVFRLICYWCSTFQVFIKICLKFWIVFSSPIFDLHEDFSANRTSEKSESATSRRPTLTSGNSGNFE
jgi:hypothetical protein